MSRFAPLISLNSPSQSQSISFSSAAPSSLASSLSDEIQLKLGLGFPGLCIDPVPLVGSRLIGGPKKVVLSKRDTQSQRSKAKKKNQDGWEEILKLIRTHAKEYGCTASEVINLVEGLTETVGSSKTAVEKPFPPAQLIVANTMEAPAIHVLMNIIVSNAAKSYQQPFLTKKYTGIKSIQFWGSSMGDEAVRWIAEAAQLIPSCKKLELMDCGLTGAAGIHLSHALKHRQTAYLRILRLDSNLNFGGEGARILAAALQFNSNLKILSLANCGLMADAGDAIAKILLTPQSGIESLNLESNQLGNEGLISLSHGFIGNSSLTALNLKLNQISAPNAVNEFLNYLPNAMKLRKINFDGNLIGMDGMKILIQHTMEGGLNINSNSINSSNSIHNNTNNSPDPISPPTLSQCEEFICSPFCSKELYTIFQWKMDEFALKFKKIKKSKPAAKPSGSGSVFSSAASKSSAARM